MKKSKTRKGLLINSLGIILILITFVFIPEKFLIYKMLAVYALIGGLLFIKLKTDLASDFERRLGFGNTWVVYIWIVTIILITGALLYKGCIK